MFIDQLLSAGALETFVNKNVCIDVFRIFDAKCGKRKASEGPLNVIIHTVPVSDRD